ISQGILQVTNSNAGVSSSVGTGTVTFDGGAFQVQSGAGSLTFSNNFKINTNGGVIDNNGTQLTLSGAITNGNGATGALMFQGSGGGTTLLGASSYTGGTIIGGGFLQLGDDTHAAKIIGGVNNSSGGIFTVWNADTSGITSITNANSGATNFDNS